MSKLNLHHLSVQDLLEPSPSLKVPCGPLSSAPSQNPSRQASRDRAPVLGLSPIDNNVSSGSPLQYSLPARSPQQPPSNVSLQDRPSRAPRLDVPLTPSTGGSWPRVLDTDTQHRHGATVQITVDNASERSVSISEVDVPLTAHGYNDHAFSTSSRFDLYFFLHHPTYRVYASAHQVPESTPSSHQSRGRKPSLSSIDTHLPVPPLRTILTNVHGKYVPSEIRVHSSSNPGVQGRAQPEASSSRADLLKFSEKELRSEWDADSDIVNPQESASPPSGSYLGRLATYGLVNAPWKMGKGKGRDSRDKAAARGRSALPSDVKTQTSKDVRPKHLGPMSFKFFPKSRSNQDLRNPGPAIQAGPSGVRDDQLLSVHGSSSRQPSPGPDPLRNRSRPLENQPEPPPNSSSRSLSRQTSLERRPRHPLDLTPVRSQSTLHLPHQDSQEEQLDDCPERGPGLGHRWVPQGQADLTAKCYDCGALKTLEDFTTAIRLAFESLQWLERLARARGRD
ncbi:hypothetical protein BKA70DRAFT_1433756 [Coprinopsis sp. MPI-PUGE-AT-0042]|nr:hypothetical protein BKA70DRAFT_1433756 [Coprinopsis sp. MPI-PUGE-AT-0042]